jgi:hypothetical protein
LGLLINEMRGTSVAGRDLRALFSSNDRGVSAAEAFTNRQAQWELVAAALAEHLAHVAAPGFDVEDLEAPRHNVLVFHGIGGIGKTTLSRKLEAALASAEHRPAQWGEPAWPAGSRILPVRIDLAHSVGGDFEHLILTIRAALAVIGRPLPAFEDLSTGSLRAGLRVQRASGVYQLTWSMGPGPAGRATWQYGLALRPGTPHIIWRRIGTHDILTGP